MTATAPATRIAVGRGCTTPLKVPPAELARLLSTGFSVRAIAERFDCTPRTVRNTAKRHGLAIPTQHRSAPTECPRPPRYPALTVPGWLQEQFADGRTLQSIAAEVGCSSATVRRTADRLGVDRRRARQWPRLRDRRWLQDGYVERGMSLQAVARAIGCSDTAVSAALARLAIPTRRNVRRSELSDPAWLRRRYLDEEASVREIGASLGVHENTVYEALARFGIPRRPGRRRDRRLDNAAWLHDHYVVAGRTAPSIATEIGWVCLLCDDSKEPENRGSCAACRLVEVDKTPGYPKMDVISPGFGAFGRLC